MAEKTEAMVLQDGEGTYYAIPLDDVEAYRVADDKQDAVAEAVGADEVSGFGIINTSLSNTKHSNLAFSGSLNIVGSFSLDPGMAAGRHTPTHGTSSGSSGK